VAQAWLVLDLTQSPLKLGLVGTLGFAPILLLGLVGGAVADRLPRRRLLLATQSVLACQALTLALLAWSGWVQYWHVAALAVVQGLANALDMPTRQSLVAELAGRDDVANAVALNSAAFNAARVVGPAVAGLLIARFGVAPAFGLNALSFALVIAALARIRTAQRPRAGGRPGLLGEIGEGFRYAWGEPRIRLTLALLLVVSLCVFNFSIYVPLLARQVLRGDARTLGFLMAAVGVGAVTGALGAGALRRGLPGVAQIAGAGALACGALAGLGGARDFGAAAALLLVTGLGGIVAVTGCNTTLQLSAPDALRGRVMSLYTLIFAGTFPLGAFLVGAISERWGVSVAVLLAGSVGLGGVAVIALGWHLRGADQSASGG
jgi:predicted MFS family arabinose efflux permease